MGLRKTSYVELWNQKAKSGINEKMWQFRHTHISCPYHLLSELDCGDMSTT